MHMCRLGRSTSRKRKRKIGTRRRDGEVLVQPKPKSKSCTTKSCTISSFPRRSRIQTRLCPEPPTNEPPRYIPPARHGFYMKERKPAAVLSGILNCVTAGIQTGHVTMTMIARRCGGPDLHHSPQGATGHLSYQSHIKSPEVIFRNLPTPATTLSPSLYYLPTTKPSPIIMSDKTDSKKEQQFGILPHPAVHRCS